MTARERNEDSAFSGLQELDRIVLQVVGAIRAGGARRAAEHGEQTLHRKDNVIYNDEWIGNEQELDVGEPTADDGQDSLQEEHAAWFESDDGDAFDAVDPSDADRSDQQGPLSETEQQFVRRTVSWLKRRDNRDIILDQVWRQLMRDDGASGVAGMQVPGDARNDTGREEDIDMGSRQVRDDGQERPADD